LVLFGFLAGITRRIEFVTGILILAQRQTVLVAKQAAEVDVLSGGRFRLGVAVGWNDVEFQALNESFTNRGKRSEEQIRLLRALFTQESVTFHGKWHHVEAAGINPLPVQRPIPLWIGGYTEATLERIVRLGDGWFPQADPDIARPQIEQLRKLAEVAGRDPASIGIEGRLNISTVPEERWVSTVQAWQALGATHLGISTMRAGLASPRAHIDAIRRFSEVVFPALP
jgi:probable F420-dependent oxidoreductase